MARPIDRFSIWFASSTAALWLLALVYLLPRAALTLLEVTPTSDADFYYTRAVMLADGRGYLSIWGIPTAFWPPGWPMALSLVFRLTGPSLVALGLFNLLCSAASGWLTLDLGRRLFGSELAGRLGLLLLALYPNAIAYVPLAMTEVFYTSLLLAGCWLLVPRPAGWRLIAAGAVFGIATLVKTQSLVVVPLVLAIALFGEANVWRRMPGLAARGVLVLAIALLTVLPWSLRNQAQLGTFVMVSTNGGITLLTGNNDSADGGFTPDDPLAKAHYARGDLTEVQADQEAKRLALAWIADHPSAFVRLAPLKLARLWVTDGEAQWAYETGYRDYARHAGLFRAVRIANQLYYYALLLGMLLAAALTLRQRLRGGEHWIGWWLLPLGIAAYPSLIAAVFSGQSRFHFPAMPFVCMACGWLLADWLSRRREAGPAA